MSAVAGFAPWWLSGVKAQTRTVGALIMRELHTRFGRENIGYLWLFVEPAILAAGIATIHSYSQFNLLPWGMDVVSFYVSGYTTYVAFRGALGRATSTLNSNGTLLYHRGVTIVDMVIARTLLDAVAALTAGTLLMCLCAAMGFGHVPGRPLLFLGAWALNLWFCFGLAMLILAAGIVFPATEKLVPPFTYLMLPMSGAFNIFQQLPPFGREIMGLIPIAHINEMVREGVFEDFNSPYVDVPYVVAWCMALTLLGFLAIAAARPKVTFE